MNSTILVATHKKYDFPEEEFYQPIHVGACKKENFGYIKDDTGDHISQKNPSFSELTALYWAWKNGYFKDTDYCGLVHYRRYFKGELSFKKESILSYEEMLAYMKKYDMLIPKKRNYWVESIEKHYNHAHFSKDLKITREVLSSLSPEYLESYDKVFKDTRLHLYNMFITSVPIFEAYCTWVFPILFEIEKDIDISGYDNYQKRVFGFLAERLFNVWTIQQVEKNAIRIKEVPVVNIEGENLFLKGLVFLKRKFIKRR